MSAVTINDVARQAGVSKKTVSRVINNEANVSVETRDKVMAVIAATGFKRNPLGMALAKNRSLFIALLADNPSPGYLQKLQKGVLQCCSESQMGLFLYDCSYRSPGLVAEIEAFIDNTLADGLILVPPLSDKLELLAMLKRRQVSYVRIGAPDAELGDSVGFNNQQAAFELTDYLLRLGHRDIGFVLGHPDQGSSQRCEQGFRQAFSEAALPFPSHRLVQGFYTFESGVEAAGVLLDGATRPSAIIASNDEMAVGVLYAAHSRGLRVPEDVSVVGIDDITLTTKVWPSLTTMRQPISDIGYRAAKKLIHRLQQGETLADGSADVFDGDLIVRHSTRAL